MMKLDIKKTGLMIAASSAFMVGSVFAEDKEDKFISQMDRAVQVVDGRARLYGNFGMELHQTSEKANADADSLGGLGIKEAGNRFGVTYSKDGSGAVKDIVGQIEYQAATDPDGGGWKLAGRFANIRVNMTNGGSLILGQQNNARVNSGWFSNAWGYQASAFDTGSRGANGSRLTGVSYAHGFGPVSFHILLGIDDTDNGDETTSTPTGSALLDKTSLLIAFKATPELGIQFGYGSNVGDYEEDPITEASLALTVSYSGPFNAHLGVGTHTEDEGDRSNARSDLALNASFPLSGFTPFVGFRQSSFDNTDADGTDVEKESETAISLGANFSNVIGGSSFVGYDSVTNGDGTEGADTTRIMTGLFYSF